MSKYLINSLKNAEINGYYQNLDNEMINGQLLYKHQLLSDYLLYYNDKTLTWNIGLLNKTPFFTATQGQDKTDPYAADWKNQLIIVKICEICGSNSNLCPHKDFRPSQENLPQCGYLNQQVVLKSSNDNFIGRTRCNDCNLYVCCCNIESAETTYIIDNDCDDTVLKQPAVKVENIILDKQSRIFKLNDNAGWYTVCSGVSTTWGDFRIEYSSGNNNRYGYINFTLHKNVYSKEIVLNIIEQRQYYNDSLEICLDKSKYIVFTDIRVATDLNCVSYIQVKYNNLAYKNGDIMAEVVLNNKYDNQWTLVGFEGPNLDSKYTKVVPEIPVDVIEAKVFGDKKLIYNTEGKFGLNIDSPQRTLDVSGTIKSSSKNIYQSSDLIDNDLVISENSNWVQYQPEQESNYKNKLVTRIEFLSTENLLNYTRILSKAGLTTSALKFPNVNLGDYVLLLNKNDNNKLILKKIISRDEDKQLIMETNLELTNSTNIDIYLIRKETILTNSITIDSSKKILTGESTKFKEKFIEGDKIIVIFEDSLEIKRIQKITSDLEIILSESISTSNKTQLLGIISMPSQFTIANNEGKPNLIVDDSGSLIFTSNQPEFKINAVEMSIEKGKMEFLSTTAQPSNSQPSVENYGFEQDFLKLNGNLKVDGQTKFTDHLFVCTNQPGLEEPDITALIDSNKGDLRLKGSCVSNRVVAKTSSIVNLNVNNLLTKTHSTWSDRRLKKDIVNIEENNVLEKIDKLNPVRFKWRENDVQDMGFIAQEIKAVFPDAVEEHDNGFLHIHYNRLMAYMVMAIKQMKNN